MGFKIKRWGTAETINLADFDPLGGAPGGDLRTKTFMFNGRAVFCCYNGGASVFYTYDPASKEWTGPHAGPSVDWIRYSNLYGNTYALGLWGAEYIVWYGMYAGYYYTSAGFGYIDRAFTFHNRDAVFPVGSTNQVAFGGTPLGVRGGMPAKVRWLSYDVGGVSTLHVQTTLIDGTYVDVDGNGLYYWSTGGSPHYDDLGPVGTGYERKIDAADCGGVGGTFYFDSIPTAANKCTHQGVYIPKSPHAGDKFPIDGQVYFVASAPGLPDIWATEEHNQTVQTPPFISAWDYWRQRDGLAFSLDGGDLDGREHAITGIPIVGSPTFNEALGLYVGADTDYDTHTTLHFLDPFQKTSFGLAGVPTRKALAWIGETGVTPKLDVQEIFELGRAASVTNRPAVAVGADTYVKDSVMIRSAPTIPFRVNFQGYPIDSPDWWFPGSDYDHYDGFWDMFAYDGTNLVIAKMPDPDWGMLNPLGNPCAYGMGRVSHAADGAVTVSPTMLVGGTSWLGTISGTSKQQLIGGNGKIVALESNTGGFQAPPTWEARIGHLVQTTATHWDWVTDVNFATAGMNPGIGEDGGVHKPWTVWCVQPVPRCRQMPEGGWLVGATLYFLPWGTTWSWDPGTRDAIFRDSGLNYVPSKGSYLGPIAVPNAPQYFVDLDEWTQQRSVYGSDALLLYDNDGNFVECMNNELNYPVNGKAFAVTTGATPKVIYRVYRWNQYSDSAEYWGCHQAGAGNDDLDLGMWVCYDLFSGATIAPGMGTFRGFLDPSGIAATYLQTGPTWRWNTMAANLYATTSPKSIWATPGSGEMRAGSGRSITLLGSRDPSSRQGTKGVGQRA